MTTIEARREAFNMGRVISQAFGAVGRNIVAFGVLALGLVALPRAILGAVQTQFVPLVSNGSLTPGTPEAMARYGATMLRYGVFSFVIAILSLVMAALLQAAVIHIVVEDLNGRRTRIADSLSTGLRVAVPVIFIGILAGLGIALGLILLIFPGFMLATRWVVAVPVRVMERPGIFSAMGRSAELTGGNRWAIFGLMFLFGVAAWIVSAALLGSMAAMTFSPGNPLAQLTSIPYQIVSALVSAVISTVASAGVASIYCELRLVKEGAGPEALAAIFD